MFVIFVVVLSTVILTWCVLTFELLNFLHITHRMPSVSAYTDPATMLALPADIASAGSPAQRTALRLAAGYVFYTVLWLVPAPWCALSRGLGFDPSQLMAYCAHGFKALQFYTIYELCKDDMIMPGTRPACFT